MHLIDWRVYSRTSKRSVLEREIHYDSLISDMSLMHRVFQQADQMATREAITSMAAHVWLPEQTNEELVNLDTGIFGHDSGSTYLGDPDTESSAYKDYASAVQEHSPTGPSPPPAPLPPEPALTISKQTRTEPENPAPHPQSVPRRRNSTTRLASYMELAHSVMDMADSPLVDKTANPVEELERTQPAMLDYIRAQAVANWESFPQSHDDKEAGEAIIREFIHACWHHRDLADEVVGPEWLQTLHQDSLVAAECRVRLQRAISCVRRPPMSRWMRATRTRVRLKNRLACFTKSMGRMSPLGATEPWSM
ncbi:hypothetical protein ACRE_067860 [Hapsidospora chrysogenum ATCC 11550]|uniref:Uncharacterized protein n=1 Tax=Hapsidospora chrysogenum (strain ATCC 11550 / CBS 779.69 / DSM 880 / IAM 14645 / JCM 23072 / IMI 49137) TaxID=857340 RepID=A0A086SZE8_HAPC1|nr:hypothetical protein ACRE_067860 [Hapsidospora chrysogenum ATCC 11550]